MILETKESLGAHQGTFFIAVTEISSVLFKADTTNIRIIQKSAQNPSISKSSKNQKQSFFLSNSFFIKLKISYKLDFHLEKSKP